MLRNCLSSRLSFLGERCRSVLPFRAAMRPSSSSSSSPLGDLEHHELGSRSSSSDSKSSSGSLNGKPLFPDAQWNQKRTLPEHERNAEAIWLEQSRKGLASAEHVTKNPPPPMQLPLDTEWPGVPTLSPARQLAPPQVQVGQLSNGLRVVTQETYGQVSALALFVEAGSMYETRDNLGVCHFLETTAFKSSRRRRGVEMLNFAQDHGISPSAISNREVLMYKVDCLRASVPYALELLSEASLQPTFPPEVMEDARNVIRFQRDEMQGMPQTLVMNQLFSAAYGATSPLGRSEKCPDGRIAGITSYDVEMYHASLFSSGRMVLSAVGVEHAAVMELAEKYFRSVPPSPPLSSSSSSPSSTKRPSSAYKGGDVRSSPDWDAMPATVAGATAKREFTHMVLGFPTVGWSADDVVPICVVDQLLGGGSSFSAGGPGKGMYSRLYREVLNANPQVEAANAFSQQLYDSGLMGIYCASTPPAAGDLLRILQAQLARLTSEAVDPIELSRARNQLASSVMMHLETRGLLCEDIGRQFLSHGKRLPPSELVKRIQAVTQEDVARVVSEAISHPPSFSAVGDLSTIPSYTEICDRMERLRKAYRDRAGQTAPSNSVKANPLSIFRLSQKATAAAANAAAAAAAAANATK